MAILTVCPRPRFATTSGREIGPVVADEYSVAGLPGRWFDGPKNLSGRLFLGTVEEGRCPARGRRILLFPSGLSRLKAARSVWNRGVARCSSNQAIARHFGR